MLHLISQSPLDMAVLERAAQGDDLVFFDAAVFDILQNGRFAEFISVGQSGMSFYALSEDLSVRGIQGGELVAGIKCIDFAQLVKLTVANPLIASWT